ncbi:MAG: acyltransferase family protein [Clostridiales bacterium]|nr:acyltransferase family protein [Clostridiales bacterium]
MGKIRNYHFDNIKAFLIFMVVIGHVCTHLGVGAGGFAIYKIIFSFHMPAFIFVSGYFAKYNPKKNFAKLLPLYLVFQTIQILIYLLFAGLEGKPLSGVSLAYLTPRWTLWYIVVIMLYQLLIPLFDTGDRRMQAVYMIIAVALGLLVGLVSDLGNFLALARLAYFSPFFLLGYYERKNNFILTYVKNRHIKIARAVSAIAAAALVVIFFLFKSRINASHFYGTVAYSNVYDFLWRLLGWGIALLWILILLIWIPEKKVPLVSGIGARTLSVYLLHAPVILLLMLTPLPALVRYNVPLLVLVSAGLTVALSWKGFNTALGKIRIPMKK